MILKGLKGKKRLANWMLPLVLMGSLVVVLIIKFAAAPVQNKVNRSSSEKEVYTCGAEQIEGDFFIENGTKFINGATQSSRYARAGKYSSQLDSSHQYGMGYEFIDPIPGKTYKVEAWRFTKGATKAFIVVSAENPADFYQSSDRTVATDGDWWQKMEYVFTVPQFKKIKSLKVYVYKEKAGDEVWIDNFKITSLDGLGGLTGTAFTPEQFYMQIDKNGLAKLEAIKKRSFSKGILEQADDNWLKTKVTTTNGIQKAKTRLKGDWLDHIFRGRSSFRVQLNADDSWLGMQTFSLQSPSTRSFLREWMYHQFLGYAGVLSPRYDFIYFNYNEQKPVIYAYEEHFTKNLVENQLRREGPIIKMTEDRFWEGMGRSLQNSRGFSDHHNKEKAFWSAEIKPFKEGKTSKNPTLKQSFSIAQNLVQQYQYGLKKPEEVFDIDLFAKYMAITDILQADHSLTWHNQRFYYNPVTALLEPIGFDGYGETSPDEAYAPLYVEKVYTQSSDVTEPIHRIFFDKAFMSAFLKYLNEYSHPDFIRKFLAEMEEPLSMREAFLRQENSNYSYNRENILRRAIKIQEKIIPFSNSLQVFQKSTEGDSMTLELKNGHILPLEVVYIGKENIKGGKVKTASTWVFPNQQGQVPFYTKVTAPKWANKIHYRLAGLDSTFYAPIPVWNTPKNWSPRQELLAQSSVNTDFYTEKGDLIIFEKKEYAINQPLILPKGKKVIVQPGTHFKFAKGGFMISFSPIEMRGDEDEPIIVESLDNQSGAVVIMQAKKLSKLRHVIFKNQNTLAYKGWNLTGAVTFYESDVEVLACQFIDNQCEDALNIVRSDFEVKDCLFQGIFGDAFDADFCKGKVDHCAFKAVGNDALDFSTSVINIKNCKMDGIGDKAISAGEHATITATGVEVLNANIGFASKDLSILTLDNVTIKNSSKGFTAYQKKPEYGAATINLKRHQMDEVKYPFLIENNSVLNKK